MVTLIVTDDNGCTDTITQSVLVYPTPIANFTAPTTCVGTPTQFLDLSTNVSSPIAQWFWDFGDGTSSTIQNPSHIYLTALNYL